MKRVSQCSAESRGFSSVCSGVLPQGKLTGWVSINTVNCEDKILYAYSK